MSDFSITKDQHGVCHLDCVPPTGEYTACGYAYDEGDEFIPSSKGKKVDCPECLELIRFYKSVPDKILEK